MARDKRNSGDSNVTDINTGQAVEQPVAVETPAAGPNFLLVFRRNHPGNRCSYGIAGQSGIVVFDRGLVAGTVVTTSNEDLGGMPPTITLSAELVQPKVDNKQAKAEAAAVKAKEKADKAAAKAAAAQQKIADKAAKAAAALAAAQAKVAAAAAGAAAPAPADVPATE